MTWNRREVLGSLGLASASALLWGFSGCGAPQRPARRDDESSGEVREWLQNAVATLHGAGFARAHALAVSRRRATAAVDVLGPSIARAHADAVVLAVEDARGMREHATAQLSADGIAAAVRVLAPKAAAPARIEFGPPPAPVAAPRPDVDELTDQSLVDRAAALEQRDLASRIVYSAALLDIDDATVWSIARGHDRVQRLVRVRRALTRVAWRGAQPSASEIARAWIGGVDDQTLDDAQLASARDTALELMTPGAFADGEHPFVLAPAVAAAVADAAVRAYLTTAALRRPEVARRRATPLSPALHLVDDPTVPDAYGGFHFDDEGERAEPIVLIDRGRIAGVLADRAGVVDQLAPSAGRGRRPGHAGPVEPMPSHLRLAPGASAIALGDGYLLEGSRGAVVDPASDRAVIAVARARELTNGRPTGRVYADVELVGPLAQLLGAITEASLETHAFGLRDEVDGLPRWRSIEAPYLRGSGWLRARKSTFT